MPIRLEISLWLVLTSLFNKINQRRKLQFAILIVMTFVSSLAEVISLGAIIPFIGILTQPEVIFAEPQFSGLIQRFGITSPIEMVLPLTIAFAGAAFIAGVLRLVLLWVSIRLGNATGADLGIEIFRRTLYQPYSVHISRNSSEIISAITQKVSTATSVLVSMVAVLTSSILFAAILMTLIAIEPLVAIIAMFSFATGYGFIAWITRKRLLKNGKDISCEQTNVIKALQEGLGAIRDVLLDSTQSVYASLYKKSILKLQRASAENSFINQAPRFAMEALGIILIALFALLLSYRPGGVGSALPALGMLALGAQRLLPLMQQLYGNWSVLNSSKAALLDVIDLLEQPVLDLEESSVEYPVNLEREISFNNVSFQFAGNRPWVIDDITLKINKGSRVGIIGPTGCGKSTLVDILMSLLRPTKGSITIDGREINEELALSWQAKISHVPQNIFLADSTIAENIAFGVPREEIDFDRVKSCAEQARIADFIEHEEEQYNTIVGERGVRLSGGQKQRIGIARALYKQVSVLVLDEATSALDDETELAVMQAIENLTNDLTIFIVAHRTSTLAKCDLIIKMNAGRVVRETTYEQINNSIVHN